MVAVSFGGYATALFVGDDVSYAWNHLFITLLLVVMTAVNVFGAKFVERAQSLIVTGVLLVFTVFIVVTLVNIDPGLLAFSATRRSRRSSPASLSPSSPISAST